MNCDSIPEVVIGTYKHIYAWQGDDGTNIIDFEFTTGHNRGRNYGIIKLKNVDNDPYPEVIIMASSLNEHVTLLDNTGLSDSQIELSVLWDHWFEYSYPDDLKALRVSPHAVNDLDNDGQIEVVYALYNDTGDKQWHLLIYDAQTGTVELDLPGYYLYDVIDLDNSGAPEICLSQETLNPPLKQDIHVLKGDNNSYSIVYSHTFTPVIENSPILELDVNSTSGNDVLLVRDVDYDETPNIFSTDGHVFRAFAFTDNQLVEIWHSTSNNCLSWLLTAGKTNGQSYMTPLISRVDGHANLLDADGQAIADIQIGSFYAMPVAADLDGDGPLEVIIGNATGYMNVLNVKDANPTKEPIIKWQQPGMGKSAKYGRNNTAFIDDYNNDGKKEVYFASNNNSLIMYDYNGNKIQEYSFNSYPYEWVTGFFNEDSIKDVFIAVDNGGHDNAIYVYDGNSSETLLWKKTFGPYAGYVAVFDFDNDGIDDIVLREHYDLFSIKGKTGLKIAFSSNAYYHTPILMDTDFDENYEIINGGGCYEISVNKLDANGRQLSQIWEREVGYVACYGRMPGTGDVDNDGHVEIGVGSTSGIFTCYDAVTGDIEWTLDVGTTSSDIICMDADNDGKMEFIFGGENGYLYIVNGETNTDKRIEAQFNLNEPVGSPIVADIDGHGGPELLVTTYDGILHCFGSTETTVSETPEHMPFKNYLSQNYPNPFNPTTSIDYSILKAGHVKLKIYDILGREINVLVDKEQQEGIYTVKFDARNLACGVYIYSIESGLFQKKTQNVITKINIDSNFFTQKVCVFKSKS